MRVFGSFHRPIGHVRQRQAGISRPDWPPLALWRAASEGWTHSKSKLTDRERRTTRKEMSRGRRMSTNSSRRVTQERRERLEWRLLPLKPAASAVSFVSVGAALGHLRQPSLKASRSDGKLSWSTRRKGSNDMKYITHGNCATPKCQIYPRHPMQEHIDPWLGCWRVKGNMPHTLPGQDFQECEER